LRTILTAVFVAALAAFPAYLRAAPRSIDDCEKIQAADAYNQCLALFGPVARGHGAAGDGMAADRQDAEVTPGNAHAQVVKVTDPHHGRRHASRHGWTRHSWAKHGHWHKTGAAGHRHGKITRMAFSVVSGRTRLR
jgi:hypothetical protein